MKVWFRVDSSSEMGTGHLMRCLTLATGLRDRGAAASFVSRAHEGNSLDRIRANGFDVVELTLEGHADQRGSAPTQYGSWLGGNWLDDARHTREAIGATTADWVIVDHYALDARWERAVRPATSRIMAIDDLADREHDCDMLLDQNLVAGLATRYDGLVPEACGSLLGPQFALLQRDYAALHDQTPPRSGAVARILVFFGGADVDNLTGRTVGAFLELQRDDVRLDVVVGAGHPFSAAIEQQVVGNTHVSLHRNLPSLGPLIASADLAVGAGGTMSWERCCLGLPSLVITIAKNQEPIAAELARRGLIRWLGTKDEVDQPAITEILKEVLRDGLAPEWSEQCRALVDGRGLDRVCSYLTLSPDSALRARPASEVDEALLLEWANDPTTRRNGFSIATIDPETHHRWLLARLGDVSDCRFYVIETADGLPVGQVRFQRVGAVWELHYSLDPRVRGRKLSRPLLESATAALRTDLGRPLRLVAKVRPENKISSAALRSVGFDIAGQRDEMLEYALNA